MLQRCPALLREVQPFHAPPCKCRRRRGNKHGPVAGAHKGQNVALHVYANARLHYRVSAKSEFFMIHINEWM